MKGKIVSLVTLAGEYIGKWVKKVMETSHLKTQGCW